jgi:two-component system osmolarity sensor histidine kinase EnvZ
MARWPSTRRSLFRRLLLAQALTALGITVVFGGLFYAQRNRVVAQLVGERWAPALRVAAGLEPAGTGTGLQLLQQRDSLPAQHFNGGPGGTRAHVLLQALRAAGVPASDVAYTADEPYPLTWVALDPPGRKRVWVAFQDKLVEPHMTRRVETALLLAAAIVGLLSWWSARRIARPLERLRDRLARFELDAPPAADPPLAGAYAEIEAIEAAWRALRERLVQQDRERATMLAGISHDLRSPLARIRLAADLLPAEGATHTRRESILRNVDAADRLIESFLDHVRARELPMDRPVDFTEVARQVLADRALPEAVLRLDAPAPVPVPRAHPLLLERLLDNLVDNALKHGAPPVEVQLRATAHGGELLVIDHGAGLPPGDEARLTEAFARADAARSAPGTGLGLAVVKRIAARMNAELSFERAGPVHRVRLRWLSAG